MKEKGAFSSIATESDLSGKFATSTRNTPLTENVSVITYNSKGRIKSFEKKSILIL